MYLHADKTDLVIEFLKQIIMVFMCVFKTSCVHHDYVNVQDFPNEFIFWDWIQNVFVMSECFCFVIVQKRNFVVHFCKLLKFVLLQIKKDKNRYFRSIQMCPIENLCTIFFKKKVVISICKCAQRIDQIKAISDRIEKFNSKSLVKLVKF